MCVCMCVYTYVLNYSIIVLKVYADQERIKEKGLKMRYCSDMQEY